jgi:L-alanine-DL-glutamate epimerase-like enolase superfamily enzyme
MRAAVETFPTRTPFAVARNTVSTAEVIVVTISAGGYIGRGEACGVDYHGETPETMLAELAAATALVEAGAERADLLTEMSTGGARNAIDCALWDLEAKSSGVPVARRLEADGRRLPTTFTIGLGEPGEMAEKARASGFPYLKVKLAGEGDIERMEAIRRAVPGARIIVDANEGWGNLDVEAHIAELSRYRIELIEQPVPAGQDHLLEGVDRRIPLCADESVSDRMDLDAVSGRYDFINIKLDKAGGLTEALALRDEALARGFKLMSGCMLGTSLSIAPAYFSATQSVVVDLDSPLLLARDRDVPVTYEAASLLPPDPKLWG